METLEKLRKACDGHMYTSVEDIPHLICDAFGLGHRPYNWGSVLRPVCDAIEAEIEERYMELPLDADGVPIQIGDMLTESGDPCRFEVMSLTYYEDCCDVNACGVNPKLCRHVKQRTVEDILSDVMSDFADECDVNEITTRYADELRQMLGGDA